MTAAWTVMVYMAGNNSLSDAADDDLREMRAVGSSDIVKVCSFVKQAGPAGARRLIVGREGAGENVEELGNIDSGSPQTVVDFVSWAHDQAPAERYALVLWNHGGGWRPGDLKEIYAQVHSDKAASSRDAHSEINVRAGQGVGRALFTTTVTKILELPTRSQREICADDGSGHSLDTIELGNVCRTVQETLGAPIELLGMDACLMSNLEVAYQVRGSVRHIVGSEDLEPGAGWPYREILRALHDDPGMDGAVLGRTIVDRYVNSYAHQERSWPVTQAVVSTDGVEAISDALDEFAGALRTELEQTWPALMTAQSRSVRFEFDLLDLATLCKGLEASNVSAAVKSAAGRLRHGLEPDGYVLAEGHLGDQVNGCQGVSTYLPPPTDPVSPFYKDLEFAKRHKWDELLRDYTRAVRGT